MSSSRVATVLEYIAANIRTLRIRKGWTQEELAEAANLTPRYVQTLESRRANPRAAVLISVADALGVSVGMLFRRAKLPAPRPGRPSK